MSIAKTCSCGAEFTSDDIINRADIVAQGMTILDADIDKAF